MHEPFSLTSDERFERTLYTLEPDEYQLKKRIAVYGECVYSDSMPDTVSVSRRLKQLRQRAGLSIREVAHALGMEHGSSYQHYEDRFRKPLLPLEMAQRLAPIFAAKGVEAAELYALAGVDGTGA